LLLFSSRASSQTQLATIFGTITDTTGAAISGAQVTNLSQSSGLKRDVPTDPTGQYHIAGLPIGNHSVRVEKEGFQTQVREGIAVTSAPDTMLNMSLIVGDLKQEVTVSADFATTDSTTSTVSGLLPEQSLTELPLNGRDLFKAAILENTSGHRLFIALAPYSRYRCPEHLADLVLSRSWCAFPATRVLP
jgi:Carboxypeptidase regulatory-like domain